MSSDGLVENTRLAPLGAEIAFCTAHYVFMAVIVSRLADLEGSVGGMYPPIQGVSLGSKEPRKNEEQVCSSSGPPEVDGRHLTG